MENTHNHHDTWATAAVTALVKRCAAEAVRQLEDKAEGLLTTAWRIKRASEG